MAIITVSGITIMGNNIDNYSYHNTKNSAIFFRRSDEVSYTDPFGNYMTSKPCNIRINFEAFRLVNMGDQIKKADGTSVIMMPKEQIQEIAKRTFYAEGQFHTIDFLTFTITKEE